MINRAAAVIKPRQPFVDWINAHPDADECNVTIEQVREDCTVILIPEFTDQEEAQKHLRKLAGWIFESELYVWYTDRESWPKRRGWKTFEQWFEVEIHSLVVDACEYEIEEYEFDDLPLFDEGEDES